MKKNAQASSTRIETANYNRFGVVLRRGANTTPVERTESPTSSSSSVKPTVVDSDTSRDDDLVNTEPTLPLAPTVSRIENLDAGYGTARK